MKPNEIKEIPHVDEDGYFDGMVACMADARGALMLGADCYDIAAPEDDGKHFFKLSADKMAGRRKLFRKQPRNALASCSIITSRRIACTSFAKFSTS